MRALDIGSGSCYLTACMALLIFPQNENSNGLVVGLDCVKELVEFGNQNLQKFEYLSKLLSDGKIINKQGNGYNGDADNGPYNAIHIGAAVEGIFEKLKLMKFRNSADTD